MVCYSSTISADVDISDVPLYATTQGAPPNIMIVIDDSWSMRWEVSYNEGTELGEPNNNGGMWAGYLNFWAEPSFTGGSTFLRTGAEAINLCRGHNKMAYDPRVEYKPWKGWPMETSSTLSSTEFQNMTLDTALFYAYRPENQAGIGNCSEYCRLRCTASACTTSGTKVEYNVAMDSSNNHMGQNQGLHDHIYYPWNDADGDGAYDAGECDVSSSGQVKVSSLPTDRSDVNNPGHDCTNPSDPDYNKEICINTQQNYANWFSYYRRRIFSGYAAVANIIHDVNANIGVYEINNGYSMFTGHTPLIPISPATTLGEKRDLQKKLWGHIMGFNSGTPIRRGLNAGCNMLDSANPASCQHSIVLALTDGVSFGTDTASGILNEDGSAGPPFQDINSGSLGDIAWHWFKEDLNGGTNEGNLPPFIKRHPQDDRDEPTEPHVRTNIISFGLGKFDNYMDMTFPPPGGTWPSINTGDGKIKDMFHAALNGGGRYYSADSPDEVVAAIDSLSRLINNNTTSATSIATVSDTLNANNMIYSASFKTGEISGDLKAESIVFSAGAITTSNLWSAAEKLNGLDATEILNREIYTSVGTKEFDKDNSSIALSTDQINYLRGDRTKEEDVEAGKTGPDYPFRHRESILGPIVNSSPVYVGKANGNYHEIENFPEPQKSNYVTHISTTEAQTAMVFAGANDGMLHGFDAETGVEEMAFVPASIISGLDNFTQKDFSLKAYVDGPITVADYTVGTNWKRILIGGLRQGGKSYYALDVSNPGSFNASNILWEFSDTANLGYTIGKAQVIPVKNGATVKWQVIFGNGYNSTNKQPGLFILNNINSTPTSQFIQTGSSDGNGLSEPAPVDIDDDGLIDYIYSGDLSGKLWRFKYDGTNWNSPQLIFDAGSDRPIAAKPAIGKSPEDGHDGVMILFGTGKYLGETDTSTTQRQAFYGIWDYDFEDRTIAVSDLVQQEILAEGVLNNFKLRSTTANAVEYIDSSTKALTSTRGWYMELKTTPDTGYIVAERAITNPVYKEADYYYSNGRIIFTTVIPKNSNTDICQIKSESWLMELDPTTGARLGSSGSDAGTFDINGDGVIDLNDLVSASAIMNLDASGNGISVSGIMPIKADGSASSGFLSEPKILKIEGVPNEVKIMGGSEGEVEAVVEKNIDPPEGGATGKRLSWRELTRY